MHHSCFLRRSEIDKMLLQKSGFAIVPYMKDLFVTYAFSYTGGALLKWYRDKVSPMEAKEAYENGQNPYEVYNRGVSDGEPSELLILPYFAGAGTPYMDNSAKGNNCWSYNGHIKREDLSGNYGGVFL